MKADVVYGIHPVMELLEQERRRVDRIYVAKDRRAGVGRLLALAREVGVPISHLSRDALERRVGRRAVHQGVAATVAPVAYADIDELCRGAVAEPGALLVLVDRVVDPRNLGAILRTCAAAGVYGVILSADETVGLTPAVAKTSAGAVDRVRIARASKPARRVTALRERGFRAFALDAAGGERWDSAPLDGRIIIVAGGEERGPRRGVLEVCDGRLSIPLAGGVESLNVGVALGVLLFETVRQRLRNESGS